MQTPWNTVARPERDYPAYAESIGRVGYACARLGMLGVMGHTLRWWEYGLAHAAVTAHVAKKSRVLEIGTGGWSSPFAAALALDGYDVIAVDKEPIFAAQTAAQRLLLGNEFQLTGEVFDLCDATIVTTPNSFDAVVSLSVLEHIPDDELALRRCCSLLRPNGLLVLTFDYSPSPCVPTPAQDRIYSRIDIERIRTCLESSGVILLGDCDYDGTVVSHVKHYTFASMVGRMSS